MDVLDLGEQDGTVVRVLTFHQCGPTRRHMWVSLLVFVLAQMVFPPSLKTNTSKFQLDRESEVHRFVSCKYNPAL